MKPCISQATTLKNPFEADPDVFSRGGWTAVEIWLTKLETFLESHSVGRGACALGSRRRSNRSPRRRREGCSCRKAPSARRTGTTFGAGSSCLAELAVPTLIVTPDFARQVDADDFRTRRRGAGRSRRAGRDLRRAARARVSKGVSALRLSRDGDRLDRAGRRRQRRRLLRRVSLLHRPEQVRRPRLPCRRETWRGSRSAT